ncbi:MAG: BTAD domain-containing putative transcriptional regulator [Caldilineaceae bacterium]
MQSLRISLLGKLRIQWNERDLPGLEARKVQELFTFLLLNRHIVHNREKLAALFWENQTTANSKKYLRQTLWQLQTALDGDTSDCSTLLVDDEWIQLNPACSLWLDVGILEEAFTAAARIPGANLSLVQANQLEQAVKLYSGELLAGWYQDWCIFERERLQSIYLGLLDKLIGYYEAHEQYALGIANALLILQQDRARECTHRQLMRHYYLSGDRTGALRQYEACTFALQEELAVDPAQSTVALYQQICNDSLRPNPPVENEPPPIANGSGLSDVLQTLLQLQQGVKALSAQLESCVHAIERTIQKS